MIRPRGAKIYVSFNIQKVKNTIFTMIRVLYNLDENIIDKFPSFCISRTISKEGVRVFYIKVLNLLKVMLLYFLLIGVSFIEEIQSSKDENGLQSHGIM